MGDFNLTKLIEKKRNGEVLSYEDIKYFVDSVVKTTQTEQEFAVGEQPDRSQIGAMLMAMYLKGLDANETTNLTLLMKNSGYVFSWPERYGNLVVDKHSTGGVGDKISLILAPALAAIGLKVPMISGRSLGHTGGTLDKLESIPGYRVLLSKEEIYEAIEKVGCCIVGQTDDCVPADKVLYQCREITATVTSPPLIIASIVSKKLSEGIGTIIYDVKFGKGSVFSSKQEALNTAQDLVEASKGVNAVALLTSMENPLGKAIGNSLEVIEAIDCLKGKGPPDVMELTCALGSEILKQVHNNKSGSACKENIRKVISSGTALEKFRDMVIQQGVDAKIAQELCYGNAVAVLPKAPSETYIFYSGKEGYIREIDPLVLAKVWKDELFRSNQHAGVGLTLLKTHGDEIKTGEAWVKLHHLSMLTSEIHEQLAKAILVCPSPEEISLICERIRKI